MRTTQEEFSSTLSEHLASYPSELGEFKGEVIINWLKQRGSSIQNLDINHIRLRNSQASNVYTQSTYFHYLDVLVPGELDKVAKTLDSRQIPGLLKKAEHSVKRASLFLHPDKNMGQEKIATEGYNLIKSFLEYLQVHVASFSEDFVKYAQNKKARMQEEAKKQEEAKAASVAAENARLAAEARRAEIIKIEKEVMDIEAKKMDLVQKQFTLQKEIKTTTDEIQRLMDKRYELEGKLGETKSDINTLEIQVIQTRSRLLPSTTSTSTSTSTSTPTSTPFPPPHPSTFTFTTTSTSISESGAAAHSQAKTRAANLEMDGLMCLSVINLQNRVKWAMQHKANMLQLLQALIDSNRSIEIIAPRLFNAGLNFSKPCEQLTHPAVPFNIFQLLWDKANSAGDYSSYKGSAGVPQLEVKLAFPKLKYFIENHLAFKLDLNNILVNSYTGKKIQVQTLFWVMEDSCKRQTRVAKFTSVKPTLNNLIVILKNAGVVRPSSPTILPYAASVSRSGRPPFSYAEVDAAAVAAQVAAAAAAHNAAAAAAAAHNAAAAAAPAFDPKMFSSSSSSSSSHSAYIYQNSHKRSNQSNPSNASDDSNKRHCSSFVPSGTDASSSSSSTSTLPSSSFASTSSSSSSTSTSSSSSPCAFFSASTSPFPFTSTTTSSPFTSDSSSCGLGGNNDDLFADIWNAAYFDNGTPPPPTF